MGAILHEIGIRWQIVLIQLTGFLITFLILKKLLFERVLAHLAARQAEEERRRHDIEAARKELESAEAKLRARLAELEKQAYEQTQAEVRAGLKRKADLLQEAQDRAQADLSRVRAEVAAERRGALARIERDIRELALFTAGQALGKRLEGGKYAEAAARAVASSMHGGPS